jgi:hypothetical protein
VSVFVAVRKDEADQLKAAGLPVPDPVVGRFLIDTGASHTNMDDEIAAKLKIKPVDFVSVHTPSTNGVPVQVPVYAVDLIMPGRPGKPMHIVRSAFVSCSHFKSQGIDGLIGRDVLSEIVLIYDGPGQTCTLSY